MIRIVFAFLCLSCFLASCGSKNKESGVVADTSAVRIKQVDHIIGVASIEPKAHIVSLYAESGGIVKKILHDINEDVKQGDLIVALDSDVENAQLQQALSKLGTQQAAIRSSAAQLASLKIKVDKSTADYARDQRLLKSGGITKQNAEDSRVAESTMKSDLVAAEANLSQQQSKLKEVQADIQYFRKVLERKEIKAPADGKILSIDIKVGNSLGTSQSIGDFAPAGPLMAVTEVDELFANEVKTGLRAYIRPQGKTDTLAWGKIFLASPYLRKKSLFSDAASNLEDRRVREVRVLLDEGSNVLIGSRVECVIFIK